MLSIATLGFTAGLLLGSRFTVLGLIPALAAGGFLVFVCTLAGGADPLFALACSGVVVAMAQVGYLAGAGAREAVEFIRSFRSPPAQARKSSSS